MQGELVVDERGRTSLARVRSHHYDRYTVEEFADGTLVLTPAITISPLELAALRDPAVMAAVREAKTGDRSALRRRPIPDSEEDLYQWTNRSGPRCLSRGPLLSGPLVLLPPAPGAIEHQVLSAGRRPLSPGLIIRLPTARICGGRWNRACRRRFHRYGLRSR